MADKSLKLSIVVAAQDLASGKLSNVNKELAGMGKASKTATLGLAGIMRGGNRLGSMFSNLKGRVSGLVGAMGPLLGIGAGVGLAAFFTDSIDKAKAFGDQTLKLKSIIGGTTESVSGLVDTLGDWGIATDAQNKLMGFGEKAIFKYTKTTKDATKFQKTFGISLVDGKGHAVDMNEALRRSAVLLQSNVSPARKNAAMTALWGRSWQQLIPLIGHGVAFYDKQMKTSDKLTAKQIKDIRALSTAQQAFNDRLDRLKVAIGLAIIPSLTAATRALGGFIEKNRGAIVAAVQGGIKLAAQVGSAIAQVASGLAGIWDKIPAPMKDLLIKGFVADRTFKFLFGFSPAKLVIDTVGTALAKGIGGIVGSIFSRGTPMPVVVTNPGALGGGGSVSPSGGGKLSKLIQAVSIVSIAAEAAAVFTAWQNVNEQSTKQAIDLQKQQTDWLKKNPSKADLQNGLAAVAKGIADIQGNPLLVLVQGEALTRLQAMAAALQEQIRKTDANSATGKQIISAVNGIGPAISGALSSGNIVSAIYALIPHIDNISLRVNGGGTARPNPSGPQNRPNVTPEKLPRGHRNPDRNQNRPRNATGILGMVNKATDVGIAGEAGKEAVAIVHNPKGIKKNAGLPVFVTNWPGAGAGGGGTGAGGAAADSAAEKWHLTRIRRGSAAWKREMAAAVTVNVKTHAHVSARETDIASKRWKRVSTANGSGVSIK